ncbi:DUF5753 domain-containing protein [Streptomyces sp. C]|uniref:DUF5753 domain-containing protein n=1 Tax=Streptomyces TaxID=1883 RepID=UPI0001DEEE13|nr:DUF5753 domain-containing protein [Streptomyces sp. C]EFL13876.1 regulatory protein [Streptomyces sp. C]
MAASPLSTVDEARRVLGTRLRELRVRGGFRTARAFAARAGWSESKVSRIEHGQTSPSDDDLMIYASLSGEPDAYGDLVASSATIDEMYVEWRRVQGAGLAPVQEAALPRYERTRHFRIYEPGVVPGLLQTPDYARALMQRVITFLRMPDDLDAAVAARINRQRFLRDGHRRFGVILEETALRSRFGGPDVMAAQLGHLLQVAALPHVSLGIVPMSADRGMWPAEGFWVYDDTQVVIELASAQVTIKQPTEIELYARVFAELASIAVHGKDARALIAQAVAALG